MYKHILVPTDGSPLSLKAVKTASKLARDLKAKITAFYVIPPFSPPVQGDDIIVNPEAYSALTHRKRTEAAAREALAKVEAAAVDEDVSCATLFETSDQPWEAIIDASKRLRCDLIVMASHGRRGIASLILGSETNKVLTHSKTPVLVCR